MSDLAKRLRIKAGMIEMGERIAWGSDSALMREAADALEMAAPAVQGEPVGYIRRSAITLMEGDELGVRANIIKEPRYRDCVAIYTSAQPTEEIGEVVVTKDKLGNIVSVTRQDAEGRVLSVIAESEWISQSGVLAEGYFHPLPDENDYEFHDAERFPDGSNCPTCVPAAIVRRSAVENQLSPDVKALVEALTLSRETIASALRASAPDYFTTDADIARHVVIQRIDAALSDHREQGGGR